MDFQHFDWLNPTGFTARNPAETNLVSEESVQSELRKKICLEKQQLGKPMDGKNSLCIRFNLGILNCNTVTEMQIRMDFQ